MRRVPLIPVLLSLSVLALGTVSAVMAEAPARAEVHHIHGLAVDRQDPDALYIATHTGLVRLRGKAAPEWIGEHRFDLMGFTAHPTEPHLVYASGHPDVQTYARERVGNLGLLVSRDGGRTWQSVALKGQADFHALAYSPRDGGQLFGWSVAGEQGLHRISTRTWVAERLAARGLARVFAIAASPEPDGPLVAGTAAGLAASRDGGVTWQAVDGLPGGGPVTALAYHGSESGVLYAYAHRAGGGLMRSRDHGQAWETTGLFTGPETPVVAVAVGPGARVAVATTAADVLRSLDAGRTWQTLLTRGRPVVGR